MKEYLTQKETDQIYDNFIDWDWDGLSSKSFHKLANETIEHYLNCEKFQKELEKLIEEAYDKGYNNAPQLNL